MTPQAERLQQALRNATTRNAMEAALDAATSYITDHPKENLEPLRATMHVIQMTLSA